jgi:hypothetical protein
MSFLPFIQSTVGYVEYGESRNDERNVMPGNLFYREFRNYSHTCYTYESVVFYHFLDWLFVAYCSCYFGIVCMLAYANREEEKVPVAVTNGVYIPVPTVEEEV